MYEPKIILSGARTRATSAESKQRTAEHSNTAGLSAAECSLALTITIWHISKNAGLRTVVDFRTAAERMQKPDRLPEGTEYISARYLKIKPRA